MRNGYTQAAVFSERRPPTPNNRNSVHNHPQLHHPHLSQRTADEVVAGKTMKEWLRFAVAYWHTWRGYGADIFGLDGTMDRPWDTIEDPLEMALKR